MTTGQHPSSLARGGGALGTVGRSIGVAVVLAAIAMAAFGPPAQAQLPELPPITLAPPPDPSTTTSTLLPPLVPTENLLPAPGPTPPPSLLPLPTTPAPRRTTTFKPPPVPPSTPARAQPGPARSRTTTAAASNATPADDGEGAELGEVDTGFSDLPFDPEAAQELTAADTMELGIEASARDKVGTLASVAAGLIAMVLFGLALWLRGEIRREPALPPW